MSIRQACGDLSVSRATFYRHGKATEPFCGPRKPKTVPRALSPQERETVRATLYSERFADSSVREVHATLLEEGIYLASVRTMYRILGKDGATAERRDQLRHPSYAKPELLATGIQQVWSWDITMIRGPVKSQYFRLYVLLDIFSRYVVGWTLAWKESGQIARELIRETAIKEGVPEGTLTIHSDRGAPMRSQAVSQMLADLRVTPSHSRPQVSNDNPYSESQFKTLKYHPTFPDRFASFEEAREFLRTFFQWYNQDHHHEGLMMLTPAVVHSGQADKTLQERARIMTLAHSRNPERFVHGAPVVKPFPREVWINKPLAPDCQKSTMESKLIQLGNEKQGLVRQGVSREAGPPDGSILANPNRKPCQSFNKKGGLHGSL